MFDRLFFTVYNQLNVPTSNRLVINYNGVLVKQWDFPLTTEMTDAQQDSFVAQKFGQALNSLV
jgi:hypothetical protein